MIPAIELGSAPASGALGCALAAHSAHATVYYLVRSFAPEFGARARRTAAEAAALPIRCECMVKA